MGDIRNDGEAVGRVGIIQWDGASEVRLRSTRSTTEANIVQTLPFNTNQPLDEWLELDRHPGRPVGLRCLRIHLDPSARTLCAVASGGIRPPWYCHRHR